MILSRDARSGRHAGARPSIATVPSVRHTQVPLSVGWRVVVRFSPAGDGTPPWSDVVGELVAQDDLSLTVAGRRGPVRVPRAAVVAAKPVPPPPSRGR